MKNILIVYPRQFNCFSKFSRKVSRIIQSIGDYSITYPKDPNKLIVSLFGEKAPEVVLLEKDDWDISHITHAIVFDDGEEFLKETERLETMRIPLRVIQIKITRVINIKKEEKYKSEKNTSTYEYIGRGSYWGNPYSMYEDGGDRDEVIRKYKYDFDHELFPNKDKSEVYKLSGKRLGCFCKPQSCHGDVLADYLNCWDDGE